jgi:predicted porin
MFNLGETCMKKSLIALAALAAASVASAQSSVTLFGVVDAAFTHGSGSLSSKSQLTDSGYNSSRLGFRGTEDLGGGMSASFWLEAGMNNDNGTGDGTSTNNQASGTNTAAAGTQGLTFNRRSTVSLAGNWGELRLGRDYTPQFWNHTIFDPFGTNGVGTTATLLAGQANADSAALRASNSIGYFLPGNLGGFYGQAMYALGENNSNVAAPVGEDDGRMAGVRLGYAAGPFNVAFAYSKTDFAVADFTTANVGGQWDFGFAKLMGIYQKQDVEGSGVDLTFKSWLVGASIPVGAGEIRASYSTTDYDVADTDVKKYALGYVHNLSKRTAVYATYARVSNGGLSALALGGATTTAGNSSNGYDIGLRHSF